MYYTSSETIKLRLLLQHEECIEYKARNIQCISRKVFINWSEKGCYFRNEERIKSLPGNNMNRK